MTTRILSIFAASATMMMSIGGTALAAESATETPEGASESTAPVQEDAPKRAVIGYLAPPPKAEWYGWQTLLVDGVSLATIPLELAPSTSFTRTPSASYLFIGSLTTYAFGAPLVHVAHGHWGRGALDLGLRVGAVAAGSLAGAALGRPGTPSSCTGDLAGCFASSSNGLAVGATIGAVVASLVDASLLARDTQPEETASARRLTWGPSAAMTRGGGTAGVVGSF